MSVSDDELGCPTGGSGYPERPLCKAGCGRRSSKGRKGFCSRCGRTPTGLKQETLRRNDDLLRRRAARAGKPVIGLSINEQEWVALWTSQSGMCRVCLHPLRNRYDPRPQPGTRVAALDHDHVLESNLKKSGVPADAALRRSLCGLLCGYPCNRLLVRHWTPQHLENAARYRREMPAQKVLTHGAHS